MAWISPGGVAVSGLGNLTVTANPGSSGILSFSLDSLTSGSVILTYNANGSGLGGVDLMGSNNSLFSLDILDIDQGSIDVTVGVTDTDAESDSVTLSGAGVGTVQFLFSAFSPNIDFDSIEAITLEITGVNGSDLVLDNFEVNCQCPEPASVVVWSLLGVVGLGIVRRRRRKL